MRWGAVTAVVLAYLLATAGQAAAGIVTVNFDPEQGYAPGMVVTAPSPTVSFPDAPVVFDPQNTHTFSEPQALRTSQPCSGGCHRMRIDFPAGTSYVAVRVGVDSMQGNEFPIESRMEAYNAAGTMIQSTEKITVATYGQYGPITRGFFVNRAPSQDIAYVVIYTGKADSGPFLSPGAPVRVDIDELRYDAPGAGQGEPPESIRPNAPYVAITDPPSGAGFAEGATISGLIQAPGGVHGFCTAVDNNAGTPPDPCDQTGRVVPERNPQTYWTHVFTNVPIRGLHPGSNQVFAWVRDNHAQARRSDPVEVVVPAGADLVAESLEITQGVQRLQLPIPGSRWSDPYRRPGYTGSGAGVRAAYDGVPLAAGKRTVVRLYADARELGASRPREIRNVTARLYAFEDRGGRAGARVGFVNVFSPDGPRFAAPLDVATARADPRGAFTFLVPDEWTRRRGPLILVGVVNADPGGLRECTLCRGNNAFAVSGVSFTPMRQMHISPVSMEYNAENRGTITDFVTPLLEARRFLPAPLTIHPLRGRIDTTHENNIDRLLDQLEDWDDRQEDPAPGKVLGLRPGDGTGVGILGGRYAVTPVAFVRKLVTHESFHMFGLEHAGTDPTCYRAEKDRPSNWPDDADPRGRIEAVGLDTVIGSGGSGLFQPLGTRQTGIFESPTDARPEWFDLMSYCSGEENAWISAISWTRLVEGLKVGGTVSASSTRRLAGRAAARGPRLRVAAAVNPDGSTSVLRVAPSDGTPTTAAGSPWRLVARDAGGAVVGTAGAEALVGHEERSDGASGRDHTYVSGIVPARGAVSVAVERAGAEVARASRSPRAPSVRVTAPRRGQRIGSRGRFTVRWNARDLDGDPLRVAVEYSSNGGRTWRALSVGVRGSSVRLPASLLTRSRRGRVRVVANDGFNEGAGRSGLFRAAGAPPVATILAPTRGVRANGDARLALEGQAFDDAGRRLRGRALRWRSGRRTLGYGERISPPAGLIGRRVTLEARDRARRRGSDSVAVTVRRVAPRFVALGAPRRLARRARVATLLVAATVPSRLAVGGRTFAVGTRPRRVRVPVPRRAGVTRLRLALRAFGRTTRRTVSIRRG